MNGYALPQPEPPAREGKSGRARKPKPVLPPLPPPKGLRIADPKGLRIADCGLRIPDQPIGNLKSAIRNPCLGLKESDRPEREFLVEVRIESSVMVRVRARSCRLAKALAELQTSAPVAKVLNDERIIGKARLETEEEASARETAAAITEIGTEANEGNKGKKAA